MSAIAMIFNKAALRMVFSKTAQDYGGYQAAPEKPTEDGYIDLLLLPSAISVNHTIEFKHILKCIYLSDESGRS
jgi:hypothetical protein